MDLILRVKENLHSINNFKIIKASKRTRKIFKSILKGLALFQLILNIGFRFLFQNAVILIISLGFLGAGYFAYQISYLPNCGISKELFIDFQAGLQLSGSPACLFFKKRLMAGLIFLTAGFVLYLGERKTSMLQKEV